jgi:hypothetical protein
MLDPGNLTGSTACWGLFFCGKKISLEPRKFLLKEIPVRAFM